MMNTVPPKQTPNEAPHAQVGAPEMPRFDQPHALVSMHDQGDAGSFPVLKAFQDYLEQERQQARKRLVTLTIFFSCVLTLVVGGFIAAFVYLIGHMNQREDRLLDITLQERKATNAQLAGQQAADLAARQIEAAAMSLKTNLGVQLANVGAVADKLDARVEEQNKEMAKLQATLTTLQKENNKLRTDMPKLALEAARKITPPPPPPQPQPAPAANPVAVVVKSPQPTPMIMSEENASSGATGKTLPGCSEAVLAVQESTDGTPDGKTIPWRVFLPSSREPSPESNPGAR